MRWFFLSFFLLIFASTFGLEVHQFKMGRDRLEVRHYLGGWPIGKVKRVTGASFAAPGGFYGYRDGQRCCVNYTVQNGQPTIGPVFKNWPILAASKDGRVRIFPNSAACLSYGQPLWAIAGRKIPPKPNERLSRQFWAVKGNWYYRVKMQGSRWDCQRMARRWGFEAMLHTDGGSSLNSSMLNPSYVLVFRQGKTRRS